MNNSSIRYVFAFPVSKSLNFVVEKHGYNKKKSLDRFFRSIIIIVRTVVYKKHRLGVEKEEVRIINFYQETLLFKN